MDKKLILITNDDGIQATGIHTLAHLLAPLGKVVVVAPHSARSGAGCSITPTTPVILEKVPSPLTSTFAPDNSPCCLDDIDWYTCTGTPVDCVKIASEQVLDSKPDLVVSGINHGDNASCSIHYSGTIGAVIEATLKGWPAIGYSLQTFKREPDFAPYCDAIVKIASHALNNGIPLGECLNVNFPEVDKLQGIRVARMAKGEWSCEWADASNPHGKRAFWLTGHFTNLEPESTDTDCWALEHGYASVTPIQLDMTAYNSLQMLKKNLE